MEGDMVKLITTAELAEYLDVPIGTVYAWRNRGDGPRGFRVGRHIRFRPEDVTAWLESKDGRLRDHVAV
jgi:excisionase family DNA binding protein